MKSHFHPILAVVVTLGVALPPTYSLAQNSIYQATLAEEGVRTPEISTEQMHRILADSSAVVLDTRSRAEFEAGHIPGASALDSGTTDQIAAVDRLVVAYPVDSGSSIYSGYAGLMG